MSQYRSSEDVLVRKKATGADTKKDLAGDFLAEKGYERQVKPRQINGGKDRLPENYTQKNKARLNSSLAKTPIQARSGANVKKRRSQSPSAFSEVRRERAQTPFPVIPLLLVLAVTVISLYVIHLYIELDELNATLTRYNNEIVEMKKEESVLQSRKASKYNLEEIERIAKEEYGMVDADQLPKEYITPDAEDSIEIMETSIQDETPGALLSGFAGVVSNLLSYIN